MKKSSRFTGLVLVILGAMVLLNNLGKPRVEALHGPDVLGLVAVGMFLGIGFIGLMGRLKLWSSGTSSVRAGEDSMKKSSRFAGLAPVIFGAMGILKILGKPSVEALHGSDVGGLVASGILLGIGFIGLMGRLKLWSSGNE